MSFKYTLSLVPFLFPLATQAAIWSPHIGADYKYWGVKPAIEESLFVDYEKYFPKITNTLNFYAGTRINGYFGVDFGFEQSIRKDKTRVFDDEDRLFVGSDENAGDSSFVDVRLKAWHMDLNFYWEVYRRFELIFMMGAAYMENQTHIFFTQDGTQYELTRNPKADSKWLGRFGFGAQYNFTPCFGVKGMVSFDPTRRINYLGFDPDEIPFDIHPYGQAVSFLAGVVYSFSNPRRLAHLD